MKLETLGHAGMLLSNDTGGPLLLTDPWLIGSTYWRSWWLQNYPTAEKLRQLSRVKFAYITHEHPDHFHPPSLRKLGPGPQYLSPDLPENRILAFLTEQGFKIRPLKPLEWHELTPDLRVLSIPLWTDDSVLLIDTPKAFIMNLNDAKPSMCNLRRLGRFIEDHLPENKTKIALSSYSPASVVNSFFRNAERVSMKDKTDYVDYVCKVCELIDADYFLPFASQAVFLRSDSQWANAFKVTFDDLQAHWTAGAELLHPYTTFDLDTHTHSHVPPEAYNEDWRSQLDKVAAQEHQDEVIEITEEDIARLEKKLNSIRLFAMGLFPRGIGFRIRDLESRYSPWSGRIEKGNAGGNFTLNIPAAAIKDVLRYDHFGDLGITMFTMINLNKTTRPIFVYAFFVLMTLHDYGHLRSVREFGRWMTSVFQNRAWRFPAPEG